jgi:hypothetical protein
MLYLVKLNVKFLNWFVVRVLRENQEVILAPLPTPEDISDSLLSVEKQLGFDIEYTFHNDEIPSGSLLHSDTR